LASFWFSDPHFEGKAGVGEATTKARDESAREILDRRYARGELTKEQYEEMKRTLER